MNPSHKLWHAPPSSKGKNWAQIIRSHQRRPLVDVSKSSAACVYGLNHKSLKWRDCGQWVILRSLPYIEFSGHPSLSRYMTFTATEVFAPLPLLWHSEQCFPLAQRYCSYILPGRYIYKRRKKAFLSLFQSSSIKQINNGQSRLFKAIILEKKYFSSKRTEMSRYYQFLLIM